MNKITLKLEYDFNKLFSGYNNSEKCKRFFDEYMSITGYLNQFTANKKWIIGKGPVSRPISCFTEAFLLFLNITSPSGKNYNWTYDPSKEHII